MLCFGCRTAQQRLDVLILRPTGNQKYWTLLIGNIYREIVCRAVRLCFFRIDVLIRQTFPGAFSCWQVAATAEIAASSPAVGAKADVEFLIRGWLKVFA